MFNIFNKKLAPQPLIFATDIHCHVIPGIDDGSPDINVSAGLIERMQSWGIKRIIATPHVTMSTFENNPQTVRPALESLIVELERRDNNIEISNAAEYRLDELFLDHMEKGILMPYPNNYILVENSFIQEPWNVEQVLFDLKVKGYKPILAHPERYSYYHNRFERYDTIYRSGTMFQVNLLSLAGYYGKAEKKTAEMLVEKNMVNFLGTDLHNHRHADAIEGYLASKDYRRHSLALQSRICNDVYFN